MRGEPIKWEVFTSGVSVTLDAPLLLYDARSNVPRTLQPNERLHLQTAFITYECEDPNAPLYFYCDVNDDSVPSLDEVILMAGTGRTTMFLGGPCRDGVSGILGKNIRVFSVGGSFLESIIGAVGTGIITRS